MSIADNTPEPGAGSDGEGRRRWPLVVGAIGLLLVLGGSAFFLTGRPGPTFEALLAATEEAETNQLWFDYFSAQDCFAAAVVELGDPEVAYLEGLTLLDQTGRLASHVTRSLEAFGQVSIRSWHGKIIAAREAIADHYHVWDDHLQVVDSILVEIDQDRQALAILFDRWINEVVAAGTPIEDTYNQAKTTFLEASPDSDWRQQVETLFTPVDVSCSRGAV
jgi:hypothetical protein